MSQIPSGLTRVPNMLISQITLGNLTRTNLEMFNVQTQLSTQRSVNRFSDDAVKATGISILDDRLSRGEQQIRNLSHADAALGLIDSSLAEVYDLALQAKDIASAQVNSLSTSTERAGQARVVEQILRGLMTQANREGVAGYIFGGSTPGTVPVEDFLGGFRYMGRGEGLITDIGFADNIPITMGGDAAVGDTSVRVKGQVDLNPNLTANTRLKDLNGARGVPIDAGSLQFSFGTGPVATIDLSQADTLQDVATAITNALRQYETDNSVTILDAGGVSLAGASISIDVVAAGTLTFSEISDGTTAADLGLTGTPPFSFTAASANGLPMDAKLTLASPIAQLAGVTGPLGQIRVTNMGRSSIVDLSSATTIEDIKNAIESLNIGVRVEINEAGTGINVVNEVAASQGQSLSIEEVTGQNLTATRLGIRTFDTTTRLQDFNFGQGVDIVNGQINPATGLPDPALNSDFSITLGNTPPLTITIDLAPADLVNVGTVLAAINTQADAQLTAAGLATTDFQASLSDGRNGIQFTQNAAFTNPIAVATLNNSPAAEQLGLTGGAYNAGTATYSGNDTAKVRVDNLFSALIDLRDALNANDTRGITFAGERLTEVTNRIAETRGTVGGFAQRVDFAKELEEDRKTLDTQARSELRDLDFTEAATRFSLLQTQLQAGLYSASAVGRQTLLDYI